MGTKLSSLTSFYSNFFSSCAETAVWPYTATFDFVAGTNPDRNDLIFGAVVCTVLSTAVPGLPVMFACTLTAAVIGACLALASMIFSYPTALTIDALTPDDGYNDQYSSIPF